MNEGRQLDANNEEFRQDDTVEHLLNSLLDWNIDKERWSWKQTALILIECDIKEPKQAQLTRAGIFLTKKLGQNYYKRISEGRFWLVPPRTFTEKTFDFNDNVYRGGF